MFFIVHIYTEITQTSRFSTTSQMRSTLNVLVDVLSTALREATNPHMKGTIAAIAKVMMMVTMVTNMLYTRSYSLYLLKFRVTRILNK